MSTKPHHEFLLENVYAQKDPSDLYGMASEYLKVARGLQDSDPDLAGCYRVLVKACLARIERLLDIWAEEEAA